MNNRLSDIVDSPRFDAGVVGLLLANAAILGAQTYTDGYDMLFNVLNNVVLVLFMVELAIRLGAYDWSLRAFMGNRWNAFDLVVILASLLPGLGTHALLLRIVRLARVVRIMRYLPDLRVAMSAVGKSARGIASMALATGVVIYIYAMVGIMLFGQALPDMFGNAGRAMLTMFMLLTLENFPDYMAQGQAVTPLAVPFFVSYALLAAFLIFNLFIGVVLNAMEEARSADRAQYETDDLLTRVREAVEVLQDVERELRASKCVACDPDWVMTVPVPHTCGAV